VPQPAGGLLERLTGGLQSIVKAYLHWSEAQTEQSTT
jgi:hypothetical protein